MGHMRPAFLLLALALSAAPFASGCSASADDFEESEDALAAKPYAQKITSATGYKAFGVEGGGFGQSGRTMKFVIDARTTARPIFFINGNYAVGGKVPDAQKYHYAFSRKHLGVADDNGTFNDSTYFTQNKRFFAGTIQTYLAGSDTAPTYAVQLYPDDVAAEETILGMLQVVKAAFTIRGAKLAFVASGPQQTTVKVKAKIEALGFRIATLEQMLGDVKYFPTNPGEAWGYLRIFPKDLGTLRPTDIPVFDELPLDLSVVAGTITRVYQDATSHVNLKSKERGTPNMVLRDASPTHDALAPFADKPVHLVVGKSGFQIEATTDAIVRAKLAARLAKPWVTLPVVAETKLASYDEMCPTNAAACLDLVSRYGGKSTGLGFLANPKVLGRVSQTGSASKKYGYDLVPFGFGVPVQGYRDFVADPANATLKAKIDALIAAEKGGNLSPNDRNAMIKEIQALFLSGRLDPARLGAITARIQQLVPGVEKIKVRSSSNAEDVPHFDGAGLYDSFSAKPAKADNPDFSCTIVPDADAPTKSDVEPKTVQCAIKAVYASLWNPRAVEERSFARLDHATSAMGLAIVPAYDSESDVDANGVVITRAIGSDILAYTISVQDQNNLVTNPDPGTIAETELATFASETRPPRFTPTRFATPVKGGPARTAPILPVDTLTTLVDLVRTVEIAYCNAQPDYYDGDCRWVWLDGEKPAALDMEFKFLANGHFVMKQAREFHGR
jgi:hypothetical protein